MKDLDLLKKLIKQIQVRIEFLLLQNIFTTESEFLMIKNY